MNPRLSLLLLTALPSFAAAQEILHHEIHVRLDPEAGRLEGDCTILVARPPAAGERLSLDLLDGEVHAVEINGRAVEGYGYVGLPGIRERYDARSLIVPLPAEPGEEPLRLRVVYSDDDFYATATNPEDGLPFSLAQLDPELGSFASHVAWYPWSTHQGKSADIHITAPTGRQVITSGDLVARSSEGDGRTTWHYRSEHGSGLLAYPFACGRYDLLAGMAPDGRTRIEIHHLPEDAAFARQKLGILQEIFAFYLETFGPYPFSKLAVVETNLREGNIGLAAQSVVMLSREVWFARELDRADTSLANAPLSVLADELAHQWNAYAVSSPNWLAEGISRYTDSLVMAHLAGDEGILVEHMRQTRAGYLHLLEEHPDRALARPGIYPALYFVKGALALDLLRERLGAEAFEEGMRAYFALGHERPARLEDFEAAFEGVAKEELGWFFEQWWLRPGHPVIEAELDARPLEEGGYETTLRIVQTQGSRPYRLILPVELSGEGEASERVRVEITERETEHVVRLPFEAREVILDPELRLPLEWERRSDQPPAP